MNKKKKYRVTFEIVVDIEADNEDKATELADKEWCNGNYTLHPYIEEIKEEND